MCARRVNRVCLRTESCQQALIQKEREGDEEGGDNNGMYVGDVYVCDIGVFKCYRIDAFLIMIDWIGH